MTGHGQTGDRRFVAQQFGANLLVCVIMTLVMTALIFHGQAAVPLWGMGNAAFDLIPSTVLPCIAATLGITKGTTMAVGRGVIAPARAALWLPRNDLLAGLVLGAGLLVPLGAGFVGAMARIWGQAPIPYAALLSAKLVYALVLCLVTTPLIVARARSGRAAYKNRPV